MLRSIVSQERMDGAYSDRREAVVVILDDVKTMLYDEVCCLPARHRGLVPPSATERGDNR